MHEHLIEKALLDEEWERNGRIYHDMYDLEVQETPWKRRTNVNSCPTQIVPVPFIEDPMGIKAPSIAKSHPQRSTLSPTENVLDITTEFGLQNVERRWKHISQRLWYFKDLEMVIYQIEGYKDISFCKKTIIT
nr:hypothetical protein [Tanacetum cinerariifolium]